ncbi:MAG: DUF6029 family protein [Bacteroidales bacterium]|jgi:hypothetical protein|nr:DUF6029 family protein [Bacteroidales bacterium]
MGYKLQVTSDKHKILAHLHICSLIFLLSAFLLFCSSTSFAQIKAGTGIISGDFSFNAMLYIQDTIIGAQQVDSKVRGNAWLNLNYTNGGFSSGARYEFYLFPLIDFQNIGYRGQGITHFFADYKNDFIQVTGGYYYEQFGQGLTFRAYEDRNLGIDNSLLGGRVKVNPYKGIQLKGIWGIERHNFNFNYSQRNDNVRGLDAEIALADFISKLENKGITLTMGGSFVSRFEKAEDKMFDIYIDTSKYFYYYNYHAISDFTATDKPNVIRCQGVIPSENIPQNVASWATRLNFGVKRFRLEGEFTSKINDPNLSNDYIYKKGEALLLTASYSMKGLGISASFLRADNMDFRSQRNASPAFAALTMNYIPAINRQYSYQLLGNYSYASQPSGQIGLQGQINYLIPKKTKVGGKYGTEITLNYARFNDIRKSFVPLSDTIGTITGTEGYTSKFFGFGKNLLYQDIGFDISRRFNKYWKLMLMYNYINYNMSLQGKNGILKGNHVGFELTYKIKDIHALRVENQFLFIPRKIDLEDKDKGSWCFLLVEYSIAPKWFVTVSDQWHFGNEKQLHYPNAAVAFVNNTTRISLNFGKTRAGILCVGGVCRTVPASYGLGLSITTTF